MDEILVEEYRGGILECEHRGHICIISTSGNVKYYAGDANFVTFLRSSAKPIQAIPLVKRGIEEKFDLTEKETTIFTASHRAEDFHVEALESIMKKVGVDEEELVCLPAWPLNNEVKEGLLKENKGKRRVYHNCSGKHLNILTLCKALNFNSTDYYEISNPAQQEILKHISLMADYPMGDIKIGVDGCGVPVFAMPIKNLAKIYLKLACPNLIDDIPVREAVKKITRIMNENPKMVSGTNLICSILNEDKNIVAKGGAKGTYCFGLKEEGLGIAIKVMDGSEEPWPCIVAAILEKINYKNKQTIEKLYEKFPLNIKNDNNRIVGHSKAVFELKNS